MGTMTLAAAASTTKSGNPTFTFLILAVLVGLFYLLIMRPQRNRQRRSQQTQSQVMPGQRVRTTAGMYGTVISGDDRDVVIEIAPGVNVTMLRRAVMDVLPDEGMVPDPSDHSEFDDQHEHEFDDQHEHEFGDQHEQSPADDTSSDEWDIKDRNN